MSRNYDDWLADDGYTTTLKECPECGAYHNKTTEHCGPKCWDASMI